MTSATMAFGCSAWPVGHRHVADDAGDRGANGAVLALGLGHGQRGLGRAQIGLEAGSCHWRR